MTHPVLELQTAIVAALAADGDLVALIGVGAVFDSVPKGRAAPYLVVVRHDVLAHDADVAEAFDHRLMLQAWTAQPGRAGLVRIAAAAVEALLSAELSSADLLVTHARHVRTETRIDNRSGQARADIHFQFFTEPAA